VICGDLRCSGRPVREDYETTAQPIFTKFYGKLAYGPPVMLILVLVLVLVRFVLVLVLAGPVLDKSYSLL